MRDLRVLGRVSASRRAHWWNGRPGATLALVATLAVAAPVAAQGHDMHMGPAMARGWVMPPMDPNMPMLPGLETAIPPVEAWLPSFGLDASAFPVAQPSRAVTLADGDTFDLVVSPVRRTIRGHEYLMYGYNGQYPGPLIRATRGSTLLVRVRNEIPDSTTVHWHGVRLDSHFDGVPTATIPPIAPRATFVYRVKVPDAGMFWYHPHVREDVQQDLGLYGNLLVVPAEPPAAEPFHREEILALDDILMTDDGQLVPYGREAPTHALMGRFGTVMLVNGEADHRLQVRRGEVVRFYLTNTANARTFNVRFGSARVKLVATDVGSFEREQWVESVVIAPAERYVVDVRFAEAGPVAITNAIQAVDHFRGVFYPHVDTLSLVTVSPQAVAPDLAGPFAILREHPDVIRDIDRFRPLFDKAPDRELVARVRVKDLPLPIQIAMEMDTLYVPPMEFNDAMPMMNWLSTGTQVTWILEDKASGKQNGDIHWTFRQGDAVKIRVFNDPKTFHPMNHPIHLHGQRFLVVARDGVPVSNLGWKDTAILPVGSTMDLLVDLSNPGDWMLHCHIAEHLHAGMMFHFVVEPAGR